MLAANALCSVADVQAWDACADPVKTEALINAISLSFEKYCGRVFRQRAIMEKLAGSGSQELYPSSWPIASSPAPIVKIDGDPVTDFEILDADLSDPARLLYREVGWPRIYGRYSDLTGDVNPEANFRNVELNYTGGYAVTPPDLALACTREVLALSSSPLNSRLRREKMPGGWDQEFSDAVGVNQFSPSTINVLNSYCARFY